MKKIFDPYGPHVRTWSTMFAISSVIAVSIDPLFWYIPVLDEDKKCLGMDRNLKRVAIVLRCVTDISYIMHIITQIHIAYVTEVSGASKSNGSVGNTNYLDAARRISWSDILIDFLAILPLPQVLILTYLSKTRSSRSLTLSKFINFLVLVQCWPRVLRVYLSCKKLQTTPGLAHSRSLRFSAILNLVLYIVASHVLGALWYFFSIQRETACWHHACKKLVGCDPSHFVCHSNNTLADWSFLSRSCPTNPPNVTAFDYGLFADAIQSGILKKTSFPKKFVRCFWWGLRNVSSFGQNLQTTTNVWETCFAVCISITALLLFIYLIGNVQMYLQMATKRSEEIVQRMRRIEAEIDIWVRSHSLPASEKVPIMQQVQRALEDDRDSFDLAILRSLLVDRVERVNGNFVELEVGIRSVDNSQLGSMTKEEKVGHWLLRNGIPDQIKLKIMPHVRSALRESQDVDLKTMLSILPRTHKMSLKKHLCFSVLKRVPMLCHLDDDAVEIICNYLKPVIYQENSYIIQQGEPLDLMFFITEGVAWNYTSSNCGEISISAASCLEKGDFYGDKELLEWTFSNDSLSNIPISTTNVFFFFDNLAFEIEIFDNFV